MQTERDAHANKISSLEAELSYTKEALSKSQTEVSRLTNEHIASMRSLQTAQAEARAASRRADEAERTQGELQAESARLLTALEEVRPRVVELQDARMALTEKVNALEARVRERDAVIASLEADTHEAHARAEAAEEQLREAQALQERERAQAQDTTDELQRGYAELQTELEEARSAVRDLEVERASNRQLVSRQAAEIDSWSSERRALRDELSAVRREADEAKLAHAEQEEFLERARTEAESLRTELEARTEELAATVAERSGPMSPGLGEELLSSVRAQHGLELSAAQSQIRALQTQLFEADARVHSLQRQLAAAEDARGKRPFSPDLSRPVSRAARTSSDELRRTSLSRRVSGGVAGGAPLQQNAFSAGLNISPETRHKRKVSLGMLKARIDSEVAAAVASGVTSRVVSPGMHAQSPALETVKEDGAAKPQFLDESHIFWCSSCRGELVIL